VPVRLIEAPTTYVAGEESAAVHFVNEGVARPTSTPPRPFERGVRGRPTLVQNVESLAHVALIARYGAPWYRSAGRGEARGTALVTVSGAVRQPGVLEVELGTTVAEVASYAGGLSGPAQAVLVGGYFGAWASWQDAAPMPLDPVAAGGPGSIALGCGVVSLLPQDVCGVGAAAAIMTYMAGESARQCGPCVFGLRAMAEAVRRLAACRPHADDLERLTRWGGQLRGRGACRHPDGAVASLQSALRVFGDEFAAHQLRRRCSRDLARAGWAA
jgi:NADH:ubiquinone oxidoreductase subunit F (NADH-binding)